MIRTSCTVSDVSGETEMLSDCSETEVAALGKVAASWTSLEEISGIQLSGYSKMTHQCKYLFFDHFSLSSHEPKMHGRFSIVVENGVRQADDTFR